MLTRFGPPPRFGSVFLVVMLLLASTLAWLAWRLLVQDRQLAEQRALERQEIAADVAVATFQRRLSEIEQDLDRFLERGNVRLPGEGAIVVRFADNEARAWPDHRLLYYPELRSNAEPAREEFSTADELEFRRRDYAAAISILRPFVKDANPNIRSAALIRIGRNQLHQGDYSSALQTYDGLAAEENGIVGGMPAALAAQIGKLSVFEEQKNRASAVSVARVLQRDLHLALWPISAATYAYLEQEVSGYINEKERLATAQGAVLAEGVQWIWEQWTGDPARRISGRASVSTPSGASLILWRVSHDVLVSYVADARQIEAEWLGQMKPQLQSRQVGIALANPDGRYIIGHDGESPVRSSIRLASATDLPWNLEVFRTGDVDGNWRSRRNLLAAGMAALFALILTGAWFVGRSVSRELAVARLQSDFVAAVSHEFRTPLTALCQLSELLKRGRVASEAERQEYYVLLHNESHRLRRLVESLLNFGRLEAGKLQFHFQDVDASALVRQSVSDFRAAQQSHGYHFELTTCAAPCVIRADRETLACVFWNLLENAVKYSPKCETVWIDLTRKGHQIEIAVRDRGIGIGSGERQRIFEKFVRGSAARDSGIRGTGIGLAMAQQIVRAHGGEIKLESEPGKGSTFRVLLPLNS